MKGAKTVLFWTLNKQRTPPNHPMGLGRPESKFEEEKITHKSNMQY